MSEFIIMLKNVILFVALALPGYVLVKAKVVEEKFSSVLSKLLTYVGMPFLILSSTLNISFSGHFTLKIVLLGAGGLLFMFAFFFLSFLLVKKDVEKKKRGMMQFCMTFSNNGFLGIPLAKAVFGDSSIVTYVIILNISMNVLMFTLGIGLISGEKKRKIAKDALFNPVVVFFILGIILNLVHATEYVPEITTFSDHFSNIVTPLSMTILGMKLAGIKMSTLYANKKTYYVSTVKLVLMPTLVVAVSLLLNLIVPIDNELIIGLFIALAMPTAGLSSAFADTYNGDTENAVAYTLGSTVLSTITIPLLYWLLCLII